MAMDILDPVTFQQLQTLKFPQDVSKYSRALVFSPDSCVLTCFSGGNEGGAGGDLFVVSWDLQTGGIVSVIRWQPPKPFTMECPSITYSANGKAVGTFYQYHEDPKTFNISICDVASGIHIASHLFNSQVPLSNDIWTHGESLRFATADVTTITIWEVGFILGGTPMEVETLPAPDDLNPMVSPHIFNPNLAKVQFIPTPCLLVLTSRHKVLLWDVQNSKCLLHYADNGICFLETSFSSNGHFFTCSTPRSGIYLWKESPTGYVLHGILPSKAFCPNSLPSPNGGSVAIFYDRTIQLWHTNGFSTSPSNVLTQDPQLQDFLLDFSPDGTLAVVTKKYNKTVTVLNLKSSTPQLTIDTRVEVYGLRVIGNTVAVIGRDTGTVTGCKKVITWNLPVEGCISNTRVDFKDSSWTISLKDDFHEGVVLGASISPGSQYIAITTTSSFSRTPLGFSDLYIYHAPTGACIWNYHANRECTPWFTPDGQNIWFANANGEADVWRIGGQSVLECLEHTVDIEHPPEGYPWASSQGYQVTDDWWILGPDGKRLLMLPPPWQSYAVQRVWNRQFLALLHKGLSEPVILEVVP
jgi:hypothetical protein